MKAIDTEATTFSSESPYAGNWENIFDENEFVLASRL